MLREFGKCIKNGNIRKVIRVCSRALSSDKEPLVNGTNLAYMEKMYESWKEDPKSVHVSWQAYFSNAEKGISPAFNTPPKEGTFVPTQIKITSPSKEAEDYVKIHKLINAFQIKGHELCQLDTLGINY